MTSNIMSGYAVIFDTNSYRNLVSGKSEIEQNILLSKVIDLEFKKNIKPYASVIVGMEMLANLAGKHININFKDSLNGIKAMGRHCLEDDRDTLRLFPHAQSHIIKSYFNFIPVELEERLRNLGGVITDIKNNSLTAVEIHNERNTFKDIKQYVDTEEKVFSDQIINLLEGVKQEIMNIHPKITKPKLRVKILDYIQNGKFEPLIAYAIILLISSKYKIQIPENEVTKRAFSLNKEFPLSVGFYRWISYKIINENINMLSKNSQKKRWNWVWDYHISFALNESTLEGREVIIVTSDKDMTEMVRDFNYSNRVFTLTKYLEFLTQN